MVLRRMPAAEPQLEAFLISTGVVALAEIGDKTQLLAFMLAAKFRRPLPIVLAILVATLVNHSLAGAVGFNGAAADVPDRTASGDQRDSRSRQVTDELLLLL